MEETKCLPGWATGGYKPVIVRGFLYHDIWQHCCYIYLAYEWSSIETFGSADVNIPL